MRFASRIFWLGFFPLEMLKSVNKLDVEWLGELKGLDKRWNGWQGSEVGSKLNVES